ncbi:MAG TPA: hypothetical protein VGC72_18035 [Candidatus Elarobacter sp.]|jgi:hypothetical protein
MMRLALAAVVLAFALQASLAHATPTARPAPHAKAKPPAPVVMLRTEIVSGDRQTAHAFAEPAAPKYVTEFPAPLTVRIAGWPREGGSRRVHFTCAGCSFTSTDQPNDGKDVDERYDSTPNTYKVAITNGVAQLKVAVESDRPYGVYTVIVQPGVKNSLPATFTLTSR